MLRTGDTYISSEHQRSVFGRCSAVFLAVSLGLVSSKNVALGEPPDSEGRRNDVTDRSESNEPEPEGLELSHSLIRASVSSGDLGRTQSAFAREHFPRCPVTSNERCQATLMEGDPGFVVEQGFAPDAQLTSVISQALARWLPTITIVIRSTWNRDYRLGGRRTAIEAGFTATWR